MLQRIENITSNQFINQLIEGNRVAQRQLYEQTNRKMLGIARRYITDMYAAEDVLITAYTKVFKAITTCKDYSRIEAWIARIVINESISHLRSTKHIRLVEMDYATEEDDNNYDAISKMNVDDIQALIDQLPEGCKMVFVLYVIEGYTHKDIATELQISEGTSKSQLSFARKKLQSMYLSLNEI